MSFILDALRKSENDRREQLGPALAAGPQAGATTKRSVWLPIIAVVLTINAIVFVTFWLTRDDPASEAAVATAPVDPDVRSLRKESIADTAPEASSNVAPPATKATATVPTPTSIERPTETPATPVVAAPDPAPAETIQAGLPSLDQLRAAGIVSVASLRVDMHVYAGDAAKRFVFVNMNKYREGDRLVEGPTIEEITPEGVIMVQQGNRFRLDRD